MELDELTDRLQLFVREQLGGPAATVSCVEKTTGHAGFSYFFDATSGGRTASYFLRLPPPGVKFEGTADVLRQVAALSAIEGSAVPHARVIWSGDDPRWFGSPYFVTEKLTGDVMHLEAGQWGALLPAERRRYAAEQAMTALAGIHQAEWQVKAAYLGEPRPFEPDVTQWDRLFERAAEPELLALFPEVRDRLLARMPEMPNVGIFHGDFQWANLLYSADATLLAVIDWELCGIGATLNDLGWFQVFNDARAWAHEGSAYGNGLMPDIDELEGMYVRAFGADPGDIAWFRALAAYKFAAITGFNLMLHRRGKRKDASWEVMSASMPSLLSYALSNLGG
jgi:aminoglycoside phosphotransferase (APT) family kinase protein